MWLIGKETENVYRIFARKPSLGNNLTIDLKENVFENWKLVGTG
jgi:hypothetical protein